MDKYKEIRKKLSRKRLDGFLVTDMLNIRYLTGFSGTSAVLFIGQQGVIFFTDFRYQYEADALLSDEELIVARSEIFQVIKKTLKSLGVKNLAFEYGASYQVFERLKKDFKLTALKALIEKIRMVKHKDEMCNIVLAVRRAENAFRKSEKWIRAGVKERKIANILEHLLKREGCQRIPFDIIVASGKNSALPHARVTDRKIQRGDLVIIDWGGEANGYVSDMTRTFLVRGDNMSQKEKIYQTVLNANKTVISCIKPGMVCREIDRRAREYIEGEGYGEYFGHATGHGVGMNVHEKPSISARSPEIIKEGEVFTVEPGIYIPEIGGVRIEDMIALSGGKRKCLTALPKNLKIR